MVVHGRLGLYDAPFAETGSQCIHYVSRGSNIDESRRGPSLDLREAPSPDRVCVM